MKAGRLPMNRWQEGDILTYERDLWSSGVELVAGIDEVGRGCLAGPVVAAAVVLPVGCNLPGVTDSKLLSPPVRERLCKQIVRDSVAWGIGEVGPVEIDEINILQASRKAMVLAVAALGIVPGHLLIDGRHPVDSGIRQTPIISGDQLSLSVAAASIVAKVHRDRMMVSLERAHPQFSFSRHKGYGTPDHLLELSRHGPTVLHRRSFAPVWNALEFLAGQA